MWLTVYFPILFERERKFGLSRRSELSANMNAQPEMWRERRISYGSLLKWGPHLRPTSDKKRKKIVATRSRRKVIVEFPPALYTETERATDELSMNRTTLIRSAVREIWTNGDNRRVGVCRQGNEVFARVSRRSCAGGTF